MTPITAPIKFEESSDNVTNLQAALLIILPSIGFADFRIPDAELGAKRASDGTVRGVRILKDKFPANYSVDLLVDDLLAKRINDFLATLFIVSGKLIGTQQQGLPEHTLSMAEYDFDDTTDLGKVITRKDGSFTIAFDNIERIQQGDAQTAPDLVFHVFSPSGLELPIRAIFIGSVTPGNSVARLTDSALAPIILMNVTKETTVWIMVDNNPVNQTKFEKLIALLSPFMKQRNFADLKEDDQNFQISFLSRESGVDKDSIALLKNAFSEERTSGLPAWAFFGLMDLPLGIAEWPAKSTDELASLLKPIQPADQQNELTALADNLIAYAKGKVFAEKVADLKADAGQVLKSVIESDHSLEDFLNQYARHEGDIQDFWQTLSQNPTFSELVPKIQLNLQLAQFTLGNTGLIQAIQERGITDTKELVPISHQEWQDLVMLHPEGIPEHIQAATVEEKANLYANELQTLVELTFPTEVIKEKLASDDLKQFLTINDDFDFTQTPVETYLQVKGDLAFTGIANKDAIVNELRKTQRLYALTASATDTQVLKELGFDSAFQISTLSITDFTQTVRDKISESAAQLYHTKASSISDTTAFLYMQIREQTIAPNLFASIDAVAASVNIPNWEQLFGQVETCECEHCRSVYSPAAYFVDLLHILLGQKNGNARNELFRRRPDLKYTKLSCEHTDTLIPYIDLVNELLETYVAQDAIGNAQADSHAAQSTNDTSAFTEAELAANPQHPNENSENDAETAYTLLSQATFPLSLPFDLSLETARQFLLGQNSSRYELMQTFGDVNSDATTAEGLGLSEFEFRLLAGKKSDGTDWNVARDLFGYSLTELPNEADLGEKLKKVREFIDRTGIAYTDLIDLLKTRFLNPGQTIILALDQPPATVAPSDVAAWQVANACNLKVMLILHTDLSTLADDELTQFNRFIRLWKKLGCTIPDLDQLLSAFGTTFTSALIHNLSGLWQLMKAADLPAEKAASLVGTIPTTGENALYRRLFLNKAILQIDDKFALNGTEDELVNTAEKLEDHIPALLAAFRISETDLTVIATVAGIELDKVNTLTLANLSQLYRYTLIAHANALTINELSILLRFSSNSNWTTVPELLANQVFFDKLTKSGFTPSAITYLFEDIVVAGNTIPPTDELIEKSASDLQAGLVQIIQSATPLNTASNPPEPSAITVDFLKTQLGILFDEKDLSKLIGILDGSNQLKIDSDNVQTPPSDKLEKIANTDILFLQNPPLLAAYQAVLTNYLSAADAQAISNETALDKRLALFWASLSSRLIPLLKENYIKQHLISQFKVDASLLDFLLDDAPTKQVLAAIEVKNPINLANYKQVYKQLFKCLWLVQRLKLTASELRYFQENSALFDGFDWKVFTESQVASWLRVADYCLLRDSFPVAENSLLSVLKTAQSGTNDDIVKAIIAVSDYDQANIAYFVSKRTPADFETEKALVVLKNQMTISQAVGASIENLENWSTDQISFEQAQSIKRALKANYGEAAWVDVSSQIHNKLRNRQRDALVAFLLHKVGFKTANELYAFFLIDVDMDACMKTSRLKQAISSVQLFVQRCVMNLEAAVSPTEIDPDQWNWSKLYRVWEANRKVFLYPENWIEPELRDNKTPFFKDLESELLQGEVTSDGVEQALVNYLQKLDDVARLSICGTYEDTEARELHVFGRTFNNPPHYYYRKRDLNTQEWTPWDSVPVDIQGNDDGDSAGVHLIPVVWNRRLYVFWPIFTEQAEKEKQKSDGNEWAHYAIKMAWSEYKQNRWSTKKTSLSAIQSLSDSHGVGGTWNYRFKVELGSNLTIRVHYNPVSLIPLGYFELGCTGNLAAVQTQETPSDIAVISPTQNNFYQGVLSIKNSGRSLDWNENSSFPLTLIDNKTIKKAILASSFKEFELQFSSDHSFLINSKAKFFYQDRKRTYYVIPHQELIIAKNFGLKSRMNTIVQAVNTASNKVIQPGTTNSNDSVNKSLPKLTGDQLNTLVGTEKISANTALQIRSAQQTYLPSKIATNLTFPASVITGNYSLPFVKKFEFQPFFHAYVCDFMKALNTNGIDGLLKLSVQQVSDVTPTFKPGGIGGQPVWTGLTNKFEQQYHPVKEAVSEPYPFELVDFSLTSAYGIYNWELFFHIPMLIANRLSKNQKFEEAARWYHFIFNPTTHDPIKGVSRYWQVTELRNTSVETLASLMQQLNNPAGSAKRQALEKAIEAWRKDPFNPHLIARMRLVAYQKNVVMKYLDNLLAWADNLFSQDTIESINQATQLYLLASDLLGKTPETIPERTKAVAKTYDELQKAGLNAFSNAQVRLETIFPYFNLQSVQPGVPGTSAILSSSVTVNYFGIPDNDKLLSYWDTVADRLFKIRHCQNIEGVERQLALFEPPIDPSLLVQAFAKGVDISSVLSDLNAPLPRYRFSYIIQKALEICSELQSLGNTLLSVFEKKDNEALAIMRAQHETTLLSLIKTVKQLQIKEAQAAQEGLEKTKGVVQKRVDYYSQLIKTGLLPAEQEQFSKLALAKARQDDAANIEISANLMHNFFPDISASVSIPGPGGSLGTSYGGSNLGSALTAWARSVNNLAAGYTYEANRSSTTASNTRRLAEWNFQKDTASGEIEQLDKQILAAQIREQIAEQELTNHEQQLDNARQIDDFYRNKYTQEELYGWMMGELSTIYFQCYQLVYDLAKKAEKTYRFELGITTSNFIQYGVWDSFRKGLLSGERLYLCLKQLEKAYMDQNRREYELTKSISLMQHFPLALLQLKANGTCLIELPEALFDADYPGHYMRRIKTMSISIPCVVGPYTSINCTLTLLSSSIRLKNTLAGGKYERDIQNDDTRFADYLGAIESVATSHAQNDSGLFELNFRDERYLPFEYAGAISRWKIELPQHTNAFDFDTLSDVILHLKYTARDGGKTLKDKVTLPKPDAVLLTVKHHFANEWYQYTQQNKGKQVAEMSTLKLTITPEQLPYFARKANVIEDDTQGHLSQSFTDKKSQGIDFATAKAIKVDGKTITCSPSAVVEDIEDMFLILRLKV